MEWDKSRASYLKKKWTLRFVSKYMSFGQYKNATILNMSLAQTGTYMGAKSDWDFRISDLVKNPDETDI